MHVAYVWSAWHTAECGPVKGRPHFAEVDRRDREYVYAHRYEAIEGSDKRWCVYCGLEATGVDHVMPISKIHERGMYSFTVPCCGECNSLLGAKVCRTLLDKRTRVRDKLRRKYASIILTRKEELDAASWMIENRISLSTLSSRLENGESLEEALSRRGDGFTREDFEAIYKAQKTNMLIYSPSRLVA